MRQARNDVLACDGNHRVPSQPAPYLPNRICGNCWGHQMYYAHQYLRAPKKKQPVTVTADGETLEGCFFLSGDRRISDLLNSESDFIPFEASNGEIYILNRRMISRVMPREEEVQPATDVPSTDDADLKALEEKMQTKVA